MPEIITNITMPTNVPNYMGMEKAIKIKLFPRGIYFQTLILNS